jgi:hypothetical protein
MKYKLIIIEGLTGSGKSTLAHFIKRQLDRNGIKNTWVHEAEMPHPIFPEDELKTEEFLQTMPGRWRDFLEKNRKNGSVAVVEAGFFNNLIETPFVDNVDRKILIDFGMQIEAAVQPYSPVLIYLTKEDIPAALTQIFETRGEEFLDFVIEYTDNTAYAKRKGYRGQEGMVKFWVDFWSVLDEIYQKYTINKLAVENSEGNWEDDNQTILSYLGLKYFSDLVLTASEAQRYVGEYQITGSDQSWRVWYDEATQQLRLNDDSVLLLLEGHRFSLRSYHFEFLFIENDKGEITSFEVQGQDIDYSELVGTKGIKG